MAVAILAASAVPSKPRSMTRVLRALENAAKLVLGVCIKRLVTPSSPNSGYKSYPRGDSLGEMFSHLMTATFQQTTPVSIQSPRHGV